MALRFLRIAIVLVIAILHVASFVFYSRCVPASSPENTKDRALLVFFVPQEAATIARSLFIPELKKRSNPHNKLMRPDSRRMIQSLRLRDRDSDQRTESLEEPPESNLVNVLELVARSRALAGKIDRELRGRASIAPLIRADTPLARLEQGIADAYVGGSSNEITRMYESPEGIPYFSVTVRGKTQCFMGGPVDSPSGKSSGPKPISCPDSVHQWRQY